MPQPYESLIGAHAWNGSFGTSITLTYTYNLTIPGGFYNESLGFASIDQSQKDAFESGMDAWSNVANVDWWQITSPEIAALVLAQKPLPDNYLGLTELHFNTNNPSKLLYADLLLDDALEGFTPGQMGYTTVLHELGHALGLEHSGSYSGNELAPHLSSPEDHQDNTVMSYYYGPSHLNPSTPMVYDIAAIQLLFGANHFYHNGDDIYSFDGSSTLQTIWDGRGNDGISAASVTSSVTIDLGEGIDHITRIGDAYVYNAFGANIENGIGGSSNDTLLGNTLNNRLVGGLGNDSISGHQGYDTLLGGEGDDVAYGLDDNDIINGNMGNDFVYGGVGNDKVQGGKDQDLVFGEAGNDFVNGNIGNDTVYGGIGDDFVYGGQNADFLFGDEGNDRVSGDLGNDTLIGGVGKDDFLFDINGGNDTVQDFEGAGVTDGDRIIFTNELFPITGYLSDVLSYEGDNAVIHFSNSQTITILGVGNGLLTIDDFAILL